MVALKTPLGLVLMLNTMRAVFIGGIMPLILMRRGQNPAAASSPLFTTIPQNALLSVLAAA